MCRYGFLLCDGQPFKERQVPVALLMPLEPACQYVMISLRLLGLFQNTH